MTSLHINESVPQCKNCRCGEGDTNIWTTKTPGTAEKQTSKCQNCQVLKSGPLLISSKGIGWTSWKKRWFILTRTSLVFFRSDPNAPPQKGSEPNLTLGGIDLSSSGSIVVKADKKLLTVLFPDGRDGRTFTLKAETLEDLNEWKTALENALAQAPSGTPGVGQSEVPHIDVCDSVESSFEQRRDKRPVKSFVVGRPVLLALEDIDGSPSFLEKALRFIEQHGIKVEGILRQSADVEEVERRVQEYEQGKDEFSVEEDAHVIGDCIKYVLRELPSSPVPASCCTALVEAYKTDRRSRVDALRMAISDTFPEPNLHLLQRILKMMRIVASNKSVNRMSLSAVAACMAPLLLRPLLAGDCEVENDFNMGGDGSLQLLQAAAAANHAQAIVMILLEEYETIFDEDLSQEGSYSSEVYTDSDDGYNEDEELTDDDLEDDGNQDTENDLEEDIDDDLEHLSSEKLTEGGSEVGSDLSEDKALKDKNYSSISGKKAAVEIPVAPSNTAIIPSISMKEDIDERQTSPTHAAAQHAEVSNNERKKIRSVSAMTASGNAAGCNFYPASTMHKSVSDILSSSVASFSESGTEPSPTSRKPTILGRTSARKNLSMESIDLEFEDEIAIQKLENTKSGLHNKIMKEVKGNEILQESLEKRKEALRAQRVALERDVKKLREQLQKERELRVSLEAGLMNMRPGHVPVTSSVDNKTRADLEEIALAEADIINLNHKVADLRGQLSLQLKHGYASLCESCGQQLYKMHHQSDGKKELKDVDCSAVVQLIDNLAKSEGALPGRGSQNVQQDMPHSKQEPSQKMLLEPISQKDDASSQITHPSSTKDSTSGTIAPSKNSWSKDESLLCGKHCEDVQTKTLESPSSSSMQPSQKHQLNKLNENNSEALRADTTPVVQKAASRRTTSKSNSQADFPRKESHALNASIAHPKSHVQDSRSSLNVPASLRQQVNAENATRTKSLGTNSDQSIGESLTVGCNIALAKSFSGTQSVKCETEDSCFLQNRQDSQKQQSNTSNLSSYKHFNPDGLTSSEDQATASHGVSSRKHSMIGEAASTSTALAKLTNRLAFLKERRIQLVNELQNLDTNRAQNFDLNRIAGLEGRPLKTNPR